MWWRGLLPPIYAALQAEFGSSHLSHRSIPTREALCRKPNDKQGSSIDWTILAERFLLPKVLITCRSSSVSRKRGYFSGRFFGSGLVPCATSKTESRNLYDIPEMLNNFGQVSFGTRDAKNGKLV